MGKKQHTQVMTKNPTVLVAVHAAAYMVASQQDAGGEIDHAQTHGHRNVLKRPRHEFETRVQMRKWSARSRRTCPGSKQS